MNKKIKTVTPRKESMENRSVRKERVEQQLDPQAIEQEPLESIWLKCTKGWIPYVIIAAMGFGLYANTFHHQFALDDDIIICKNEYVLKGIGGMGDIMTKDLTIIKMDISHRL